MKREEIGRVVDTVLMPSEKYNDDSSSDQYGREEIFRRRGFNSGFEDGRRLLRKALNSGVLCVPLTEEALWQLISKGLESQNLTGGINRERVAGEITKKIHAKQREGV